MEKSKLTFSAKEFEAFHKYILYVRAREIEREKQILDAGISKDTYDFTDSDYLSYEEIDLLSIDRGKESLTNADFYGLNPQNIVIGELTKKQYHLNSLREVMKRRLERLGLLKDYYKNNIFTYTDGVTRKLSRSMNNVKNGKDVISLKEYQVYFDFIGVKNKQECIDKIISFKFLSDDEHQEYYFRGYFYDEPEKMVNVFLATFNFKNGKESIGISTKPNQENAREHYKGDYKMFSQCMYINTVTKDKKSCLQIILAVSQDGEARIKNEAKKLFIGSYSSINKWGNPSCGILCLERIDTVDEAWNGMIDPAIKYYLDGKRLIVDDADGLSSIESFYFEKNVHQEKFHSWKQKKNIIEKWFSGTFIAYSLYSSEKAITISYVQVGKDGSSTFKSPDETIYSGVADLMGDKKCVIRFSKKYGEFFSLLERKGYDSGIIEGDYMGVIDNQISGGRILLIRQDETSFDFEKSVPKRITVHSREYDDLLKSVPTLEEFFTRSIAPNYDDKQVITPPKDRLLPLPKRPEEFDFEGLFDFMILSPNEKIPTIRSCPIQINKDGYIIARTLHSSNRETDFYIGRAFIHEKRLYIHLYYENNAKYHGLMVFETLSDKLFLHGVYNTKMTNGTPVCGRVVLIRRRGQSDILEEDAKDIIIDTFEFNLLNQEFNDVGTFLIDKQNNYIIASKYTEGNKQGMEKATLYFRSAAYLARNGDFDGAAYEFSKAMESGFNDETLLMKECQNGAFEKIPKGIMNIYNNYKTRSNEDSLFD